MKTIGLLSCGRGGDWSVDIDEVSYGEVTFYGITILHPNARFQFDIHEISKLEELALFLGSNNIGDEVSVCMGRFLNGELNIVIYDDRMWFRIHNCEGDHAGSELAAVPFEEKERFNLSCALNDALQDL